jgi:hypothetical protein
MASSKGKGKKKGLYEKAKDRMANKGSFSKGKAKGK